MSPRVTVVIPTYRRPDLLRRAIRSALDQAFTDLKVAVFDNASGDATAEVVARMARVDPRVTYHANERNLGAVPNFRKGIESVTTPWFCLLSDDDLLLPGFLDHAMQRLETTPRAKFFCGQIVRYHVEDGRHELRPARGWRDGLHEAGMAAEAMVRNFFAWTSVVFSRDVREAGTLEEIDMVDLLYMARAATHFPFYVSLRPCAVTTRWGGNAMLTMPIESLVRSYRVTAEVLTALPGLPDGQRRAIREILDQRILHALRARMNASRVLAGDWETIRRAGEYLDQEGSLTWGRRIRYRLSDPRHEGGLARAALERLLHWQAALARRRGSGEGATLEEVVRRYADQGGA